MVQDDDNPEKRFAEPRRTVESCGRRLHAFVLMNDRDHWFGENPAANLSLGMPFLEKKNKRKALLID